MIQAIIIKVSYARITMIKLIKMVGAPKGRCWIVKVNVWCSKHNQKLEVSMLPGSYVNFLLK